ncbi:metallopeptidase family protein [Ancylobacter sp. A5.8]|uniref:metallopeptidase family protein n=1 Tax=Ancylobacter gelatini TaxID=2919920 RepID=UPI001F4E991A|nr:metallopeptidase family protein [Ancylobacter gelatini]MCJ8144912.1 metallopeptidase family protein [Ancylobacter gelatini]
MNEAANRLDAEPEAWAPVKAPSLAQMEVMAQAAYERLPDHFRAMCGNMVVQVDDFPSDEVLEEMEAETPFDLLGLFQGIGLAQGFDAAGGVLPNMIHLYRRPILDYWAENDETLGAVVTHVLIHEIGHHFGLSDEDMERIEEEGGST